MAGRHARLDRLTPLDMSNLRVEEHGSPMHVAALVVLEPADPGRLDLDRLRGIIEGRLSRVPRLRQVLYRPPPGLGPPVWVDARDFDIRQHVRARPVPGPLWQRPDRPGSRACGRQMTAHSGQPTTARR